MRVTHQNRGFTRERERERESKNVFKKGIPIGNLTSQLFANVYLNVFDQFMNHELKVKKYARYTDDFVIIAQDPVYLNSLIGPIQEFLNTKLKLALHPRKVTIRKHSQGIDFLGYVILPHYQILRARTRKRMWRKMRSKMAELEEGRINQKTFNACVQSYLGVLSHGSGFNLSQQLKNEFSSLKFDF